MNQMYRDTKCSDIRWKYNSPNRSIHTFCKYCRHHLWSVSLCFKISRNQMLVGNILKERGQGITWLFFWTNCFSAWTQSCTHHSVHMQSQYPLVLPLQSGHIWSLGGAHGYRLVLQSCASQKTFIREREEGKGYEWRRVCQEQHRSKRCSKRKIL